MKDYKPGDEWKSMFNDPPEKMRGMIVIKVKYLQWFIALLLLGVLTRGVIWMIFR